MHLVQSLHKHTRKNPLYQVYQLHYQITKLHSYTLLEAKQKIHILRRRGSGLYSFV